MWRWRDVDVLYLSLRHPDSQIVLDQCWRADMMPRKNICETKNFQAPKRRDPFKRGRDWLVVEALTGNASEFIKIWLRSCHDLNVTVKGSGPFVVILSWYIVCTDFCIILHLTYDGNHGTGIHGEGGLGVLWTGNLASTCHVLFSLPICIHSILPTGVALALFNYVLFVVSIMGFLSIEIIFMSSSIIH